jgi:hypothetical protein
VGKIVPHNQEGSTVNLDQTPLTIRTKEIENDPDAPLIVPDVITKTGYSDNSNKDGKPQRTIYFT